ncbi:hypothetical protein OHA25_41940 [Nonomuraea sp. NBC_00507]|uniref:hypothetical protein n=1 Tax=Nonomuraea sp. NBC_00507 TaxID=2976002 RepID=UPI002E175DA2
MADISYFEAWGQWLQGRSTLGYDMLGMPVIWWGRFGKILSFLAGAAVLIDLVGPEKLFRYGDRLVRSMAQGPLRPFIAGLFAGVIAGVLVDVATGPMGTDSPLRFWLATAAGGAAGAATVMIGFALQHPEFSPVARWISLGLFLLGFHFDLLAS